MYRAGIGQDSHKFTEDNKKKLVLGGVLFEGTGLKGNSDGDAILHALVNALSSAIGGRSISFYADDMCKKGITDSKEYVKEVMKNVYGKGYAVSNVSIAIECKTPKIEPKVNEMKKSVAKILDIEPDDIGITATSGEGLTAFGRGEGVQVFCKVMLIRK